MKMRVNRIKMFYSTNGLHKTIGILNLNLKTILNFNVIKNRNLQITANLSKRHKNKSDG